ncbi:type I-E CRISPR-associated endoribonuclease Cas2e [Nocardiopsis sp. MG754419]|uniref:type I-E CRISPR-associated endoribonuclease Cas2e n=1 Tax=Nocardiopsis sp. MG754419 TaxID=2259865 RepID=UPI001BADF1A1|nr:type I-E CRISPR-associated endoribonuclease Cas2e [Nocardiopsis sp. MG754419]MBR8740177.1 type I-E CRISPR-associated endoribonuclease Cas2 [Nocardiopsis sp. MG754419]
MTVIILTNCPSGLRGLLTRWLLQIAPTVFIGKPSARVRQVLWDEVHEYAGNGRALLVYTTNSEQGFAFETFEHTWRPVDHEGMTLIERPKNQEKAIATPKKGWSKASKRRRFAK